MSRSPRTFTDYVALAVATCGVGYIPLAPGTWGSAVGVLVYLLLRGHLLYGRTAWVALLLGIALVVTLAGVWAATRAEAIFARKDPGRVVVDEVAGQLLTFLLVPATAAPWVVVTGFALFRLFDIWKPFPIRRFEALPSGLGIMADDLVAGIYGAVVLAIIVAVAGTSV